MGPIAIAALYLAGVTGLVALTSKKASASGGPLPTATPQNAGTAAKVGDEVVFPVSAIPGLNAPPNAGGIVLLVDRTTPTTLIGPFVAFVGPGGTADLSTPGGPLELSRAAVSTITVAPMDRVGRFALPEDDVFLLPANLPDAARAALTTSPELAALGGIAAPNLFAQVHLKEMDATGAVAGNVTAVVTPTGVRSLATPIPTEFFPRVGIVRVVRNGALVFEKRPAPPKTASDVAQSAQPDVALMMFIAQQPTAEAFRARFPGVQLVLPGMTSTNELRTNNSRYFAVTDPATGRLVGGSFG